MWTVIVWALLRWWRLPRCAAGVEADPANLGYVTERWLMEYRADQTGESVTSTVRGLRGS